MVFQFSMHVPFSTVMVWVFFFLKLVLDSILIFLPFCFPFSMGYMILSPPKRGSIFFLYKEKTNSENYKRKLM